MGQAMYDPRMKIKHQGQETAFDRLQGFSITGSSKAMRQQMLEDTFVLKDLALLGQWTVFYGAPNAGKTLITLWLLKEVLESLTLDGDHVFYINSDDNYRGLVEKVALAEKWGFHMIAPNQKSFKNSDIIELIIELAESGEARGTVIVLDTLKKFTDLMQKREAAEFGIISRSFVSSGGTLICLAHVNKQKNSEGKSVFAGTSDIRDDADCAFIIDKVGGQLFEDEIAVEFVNHKARGDVSERVSFSYSKRYGQSYAELVESVARIDDQKVDQLKLKAEVTQKLDEDAAAISAVFNAIKAGITSKAAIIKNAGHETGISHKTIRRVLDEREGAVYSLGHRWQVEIGKHNKSTYSILAEI